LVDDVADMQADPKLNGASVRARGPFVKCLLDRDGASSGIQGVAELDQEGVPDRLDLAALVTIQERTHEASVPLESLEGLSLVALRKRRVADQIGQHDGGKPALALEHEDG